MMDILEKLVLIGSMVPNFPKRDVIAPAVALTRTLSMVIVENQTNHHYIIFLNVLQDLLILCLFSCDDEGFFLLETTATDRRGTGNGRVTSVLEWEWEWGQECSIMERHPSQNYVG